MADSRSFTLDSEFDDEFDPLEDTEEDFEEDGPDGLPSQAAASEISKTEQTDERSAEERLADLLAAMAPRRKVLLGILAFCETPQPVNVVNQKIDELQAHNYSVYTAADLCALLERVGGLDHVTEEGGAVEELETQEPEVVEVDGIEYLEVKKSAPTFWATTEAGMAAVEADRPVERMRELFEEEAAYLPIYKRILRLCSQEGGASISVLGTAVDSDPLVQKPRLYVAHFVDRLEKCDAVEWTDSWNTTEVGKLGLELLADVQDAAESEEE